MSLDRSPAHFEFGQAASRGDRAAQQDSIVILPISTEGTVLVVIADGMGGHEAGEIASRIVCDEFTKSFLLDRAFPVEERLTQALDRANAALGSWRADRIGGRIAGSTCLAVHFAVDRLSWISVGDSPLWIWSRGALVRLNDDHSMRAKFRGKSGSVLRSAVVGEDIPLRDLSSVSIQPSRETVAILATDGILTLKEGDITGCVEQWRAYSPRSLAQALVKAVGTQKKPRQDNCTVAVVTWPSVQRAGSRLPFLRSAINRIHAAFRPDLNAAARAAKLSSGRSASWRGSFGQV